MPATTHVQAHLDACKAILCISTDPAAAIWNHVLRKSHRRPLLLATDLPENLARARWESLPDAYRQRIKEALEKFAVCRRAHDPAVRRKGMTPAYVLRTGRGKDALYLLDASPAFSCCRLTELRQEALALPRHEAEKVAAKLRPTQLDFDVVELRA